MTDKDLLLAISSMMEQKLKPFGQRMDSIEETMNRRFDVVDKKFEIIDQKFEAIDRRFEAMEKRFEIQFEDLSSQFHVLKLELENNITPRLQNIEECYLSTYQRYKNGVEHIEALQMDMNVVKDVLQEHSEKLRKIS